MCLNYVTFVTHGENTGCLVITYDVCNWLDNKWAVNDNGDLLERSNSEIIGRRRSTGIRRVISFMQICNHILLYSSVYNKTYALVTLLGLGYETSFNERLDLPLCMDDCTKFSCFFLETNWINNFLLLLICETEGNFYHHQWTVIYNSGEVNVVGQC
jgi:hypothetical protein